MTRSIQFCFLHCLCRIAASQAYKIIHSIDQQQWSYHAQFSSPSSSAILVFSRVSPAGCCQPHPPAPTVQRRECLQTELTLGEEREYMSTHFVRNTWILHIGPSLFFSHKWLVSSILMFQRKPITLAMAATNMESHRGKLLYTRVQERFFEAFNLSHHKQSKLDMRMSCE